MTNEVGNIGAGSFQYVNPYYDIEDLDPTYSTYPMYNSPMGMDGSIFGMGMMPMMGMGCGNNQSYFDNMRDYQRFYIDYNVDQQRMQRNADLRINASMEAVQSRFATLKDKINANEQGQIQEAYNNFVAAVANAYGAGSEQEIKARAASLYTQLNGGKTIAQDLRESGHSSFTQGLIHGVTFGLVDSRSAEDNISQITGAPVGTGEKAKQNFGRLAGAGVIGGIAGGIAHACKSGKAAVIGLAAGAIAAISSFITGKITT